MNTIRWAVISICALTLGCGHGPDIHIIVPNDYRGVVKILEIPSAPEMPLVDGTYKISVTDVGYAEVRSLEPFGKWQGTKVFTADGKELNDVAKFEEVPGEVQWWDLGRQSRTGPNGPPASVDLFIGTPDELRAFGQGREQSYQIIDKMSSLADPADCLGNNTSAPCRKTLDELARIAKSDTITLELVYGFYDERRSPNQSNRIDNLLSVLTRMAFKVESLSERKRFTNMLDDGASPHDWLYPLAVSGGEFVLLGEGFRGHQTGVYQGPKAEFEYVAKRVARR